MTNNGITSNDFKLGFTGYLEITKDLPNGPMELVMEVNKCDLQMKACDKHDKFSIGGLCSKFKAKNTFFSGTLEKIVPPIACPLKRGNYTFENPELDLSFASRLPIDGW